MYRKSRRERVLRKCAAMRAAKERERVGPVVGNRVKCKACGHDIHVDHFAGICGGDFYCDSISCLLVLSDRISNAEHETRRVAWQPSTEMPKANGEYVCITNYDDVFMLRFCDGSWKPAHRFNRGEKVAWWIPIPATTPATGKEE